MDVGLAKSRLFLLALSLFFLVSCGNRFDLSKEYGRRARIDQANYHLSRGECQAALEAINPLYASVHVDDEVRIITASAHACSATFSLLTVAGNLFGSSNYFNALAKSMKATTSNGHLQSMYAAVDILTASNVNINASQRSTEMNNYMIFLQMGVVGAVLSAYGNPNATTGAQGTNLAYSNPRGGGEMANEDACALAAAFGIISDSFNYSSITDADAVAVKNSLNNACVSAGLASCDVLNKVRSNCTGLAGNAPSIAASNIVGAVNGAW